MAERPILIVDDDADVRDSLRALLEFPGLQFGTIVRQAAFCPIRRWKRGCA